MKGHPNGHLAAKAVLAEMMEERSRWITKLQTDNTRRGPRGADLVAIEGLKQERDALAIALENF